MMAAKEIASPKILPIRQQAENSKMEASGYWLEVRWQTEEF